MNENRDNRPLPQRLPTLAKILLIVLICVASIAVQELYQHHLVNIAVEEAMDKLTANDDVAAAIDPTPSSLPETTGMGQIKPSDITWSELVESSVFYKVMPLGATLYQAGPSRSEPLTDEYLSADTAFSVQLSGIPRALFANDSVNHIKATYPQYICAGEIGIIHVEMAGTNDTLYVASIPVRAKETLRLIHGYSNPSTASGADIIRPESDKGTLSLLFYTGATADHLSRSSSAGTYGAGGDFVVSYNRLTGAAREHLIEKDYDPYVPGPIAPTPTQTPHPVASTPPVDVKDTPYPDGHKDAKPTDDPNPPTTYTPGPISDEP